MKIRFLGTGAAEGIPSFGCTCQRCQVARKEGGPNVRQRASVLIEAAGHRILLDTPPEINSMLNQAEVFDLSAILLSHEHFDHIGGLIAFEYWNLVLPIAGPGQGF
jgi:phosphoribosyl 1,2-cyclic phosphate phosphodiesterase